MPTIDMCPNCGEQPFAPDSNPATEFVGDKLDGAEATVKCHRCGVELLVTQHVDISYEVESA